MLQLQLKSHRIGHGQQVLGAIECDFPVGQLSVVVGANGAGKSTLLRLLSGWEKPSSGDVLWNGDSLALFSPAELAKKRAFLPQDALRYTPSLTVHDMVSLGCTRDVGIRASLIAEAMDWMGLMRYAGQRYTDLSGGEQQRVHLARCRVQMGASIDATEIQGHAEWLSQAWVVLDEPVQYLDVHYQKEVLSYWRAWAKEYKATVIISLHQLDLVAQYADFVLALNRGKIVSKGVPSEVLSQSIVDALYDEGNERDA
jgi:iron complex transport system ATP-binding protein